VTEHETPENPPQTGPETPNEQPETAATEPTSSEPTAPGYPGIPPAPADPLQTLPGPNTAGYLPGGHQLPTGEPQATPFDPDRGYAPGPVPAPSPLDPALPPGPFPEQTPDGFGPNKKLPTGALIGIIAGGIIAVIVLAAVIIIPLANRGGGASGGSDGPPPSATTPEEFVEGYLNAIADGDADAALEYVDATGYSKDLLTDEVLAASLELGAIDDIEVGETIEGEHDELTVPATFKIGGEEVSREFRIYQSSYDGDITMYDGLVSMSVSGFDGIGIFVNGAEVPESAVVFPGTYGFTVGLDAFAVEGEAVHRLVTDDDADALYDLQPTLSEAGLATFREMVSTSLRECLAMTSLNTPCGMDVTGLDKDGYAPVDGTIARRLSTEGETTLANVTPRISERAVVTSYDAINAEITLTGQNASGQQGQFEVLWGAGMLAPKVDFAAEVPTVVWE
jgi:hypothetical protein